MAAAFQTVGRPSPGGWADAVADCAARALCAAVWLLHSRYPDVLLGNADHASTPSSEEIPRLLSGHICRCTGYRGIIAAVQQEVARLKASEPPTEGQPTLWKSRMFDLGRTLLQSVERSPGSLALVDGGLRLSYADWAPRVFALSHALHSLGLRRGDAVLSLLQNRWEAATLHWPASFRRRDHSSELAGQSR